MERVLVAGATGYLGRFVLSALRERGYWVRALSRSAEKLTGAEVDEIFVGKVTEAETLRHVARSVDIVISTVGITRQRDGLTYDDVDYQGNVNLLNEALASGAKKFIYVAVLNAHEMPHIKIVRAKERFVDRLRAADIDYAVVRPNAFFSDMTEFLKMAHKGRVALFGDGGFRLNPNHGRDVADVCVSAIADTAREISFGGPYVYTHREIAEAAFHALGKAPRFVRIPAVVPKLGVSLARWATPSRVHGPIEFALTALTRDMIGEARGTCRLTDYFAEEAGRLQARRTAR